VKYLRRLGKVLHISKRGSIILQTDKTPSVGGRSVVLDKKAQEVGIIIDVFGPVKTPYVAVRPKRKTDPHKLVGQMLYLQKK
jgi:RNA-binding protein